MLKNSLLAFYKALNIKIDPVKLSWGMSFGLLLSAAVIFSQYGKFGNGKLQIFACNVGQGDAIYIKTPKGLDILIDGGPDNSVLKCLGEHMPFWDHKIEMVFLTHPHSDHLTGIATLLGRYKVDHFFASVNSSLLPKNPQLLVAGDKIKTADGVALNIIWPTKDFIASDLNQMSLVLLINNNLFMGDADAPVQPYIMAQNPNLGPVDILKVPHHGSRAALDPDFLKLISPKVAIISVGKNDFGHPAPETINMLEVLGAKVERTDK